MNNEEKILSMLEVLTTKVDNIDGRLTSVETEVQNTNTRLTNIETDIKDVKFEILKTNISIENHVWPAIQAIKEGYSGLRERIINIEKNTDEMASTGLALDIMHIKKDL